MRTIICHYHIYKNSGTSFDTLLTENFGDQHICFDGPFPFFLIDQEQLNKIIERRPNALAFSSHQIQLPVPASLDYDLLPVVFVRHPLLRIQSIYKFKRQNFDGTTTSSAAQKMTLSEWLQYCFSDKQEITHISNAQTRILAGVYKQKSLIRRKEGHMEYDLNQALRNIKNVELLARTEFFDKDVSTFEYKLAKYGISFNYRSIKPKNTTSNDFYDSIESRIKKISDSVSGDLYQRLIDSNQQDLKLFEVASSMLD